MSKPNLESISKGLAECQTRTKVHPYLKFVDEPKAFGDQLIS
jgi:hypothetical protein